LELFFHLCSFFLLIPLPSTPELACIWHQRINTYCQIDPTAYNTDRHPTVSRLVMSLLRNASPPLVCYAVATSTIRLWLYFDSTGVRLFITCQSQWRDVTTRLAALTLTYFFIYAARSAATEIQLGLLSKRRSWNGHI